ncbi:MAG: PEP-utilizing enzyme [Chloroflexota bacterium]
MTTTTEESPTDAFPIVWEGPDDLDVTWEWDDMHMPVAVTPLSGDYNILMGGGFAYGYERLSVPYEVLVRVWNCYTYFGARNHFPEAERATGDERYTAARRAAIPLSHGYWQKAVAELTGIYSWIEARPVETAPLEDLAPTWDDAWARIARAWSIHFYAIRGPYQVLDDLADLYESVVPDASPGEALGLIGGTVHELHEVERGLERLASLAAESAAVEQIVRRSGITVDEIERLPEAATFADAFRAFLAEHGHLGQMYDDLALASWIEEPELLITEIAKRIEHPMPTDADTRRARLAAEAEVRADRARQALTDDADRLARFEELLGHARRIGPLTEVHNYWIDRRAQASLRRFVMRVGERLAEAGVIGAAADILFLHRAEVPSLLTDPAAVHDLVEARRADHRRWSAVRPPRRVGKAPDPVVPGAAANADRFDGARFESTDPGEIRGTGASAGVARGRARVTLTPDAFGAVQAGDIIVCPSSNPSWVPLFAIAAGLITDTGGVLSHAAVVAREFELPAVVGTGDATTRIVDGRLVEIDGTTGIVRLL